MSKPFLEVKDLKVHFPTEDGLVRAVDGVSFSVEKGKTLGIVGESGSGKSVTSLAVMGLHKESRAQVSGEILIDGIDVNASSESDVRALRGKSMAMIFQDALAALHPYYKVGAQIAEAYRVHNDVSKKVAHARAVEMLDRVGIPVSCKTRRGLPSSIFWWHAPTRNDCYGTFM
jgi:peptide/nickel transport system ATP-binding protein